MKILIFFLKALSLYALYHWLEGNSFRFIFWSAAGILIFRGELAIFLGTVLVFFKKKPLLNISYQFDEKMTGLFLLMDLIAGRIKIIEAFAYGLTSLVIYKNMT